MNEWYKDPKILIIAGVALFGGFILLRNQNSGSVQPSSSSQGTTTPVGGSYTYLDGSGIQHMVMTDPNGNLVSYNTTSPNPQSNQLSTYTGMMSPYMYSQPYGGNTPYYSQLPTGTSDTGTQTTPTTGANPFMMNFPWNLSLN